MPPMSCTSKWRWPITRPAASRTVAKDSTSRSSRLSPLSIRSRKSTVRWASSSSESDSISGSSSLMRGTSSASRRTFFPSPARRTRVKTLMRARVYRRAVPAQRRRGGAEARPAWASGGVGEPLDGVRGPSGVRATHQLALQPLDLVLELVDDLVHGDELIAGGRFGPQGVPVAGDGDLAHLPGRLARTRGILILGEAHLGSLEHGVQPPELGHLRLGERPHFVGHGLLASQNSDVHRCTSFRPWERWSLPTPMTPPTCMDRVRLTWSLSPHSPAEDLAARVPAATPHCDATRRHPRRLASILLRRTPTVGAPTGRAY